MAWKQVVDWSNTDKRNIIIPSTTSLTLKLPNEGDFLGTAAVIEEDSTTNDLSGDVGKFVVYTNYSAAGTTYEYGKWKISDASSHSKDGRNLLGIVTSKTSADTPVILLEGIIRLDGDDFDTDVEEADFHLGAPAFLHPSTNGRATLQTSTFGVGNLIRSVGYVLDFATDNGVVDHHLYFYFKPDLITVEM